MNREFSNRTRVLVGDDGVGRLEKATVAVFGIGGVGSYAVEALARAGVGHLVLVDFDVVRASNINRQLPATVSTLGHLKVESMAERLLTINPDLSLDLRPVRFSRAGADELLDGSYDFIVDAIDSLSAKVNLIHECILRRLPVVSSMGSASKIRSHDVRVGDLSESAGCPLARMVRKRLRRRGVRKGIPVVYSQELPILSGRSAGLDYEEARDGEEEGEGVHGTISYMPGLFGLHCAGYVIQSLLKGVDFVRRGDTPPTRNAKRVQG